MHFLNISPKKTVLKEFILGMRCSPKILSIKTQNPFYKMPVFNSMYQYLFFSPGDFETEGPVGTPPRDCIAATQVEQLRALFLLHQPGLLPHIPFVPHHLYPPHGGDCTIQICVSLHMFVGC
jgi:hypothetical protein